jgi:hypothetical protein
VPEKPAVNKHGDGLDRERLLGIAQDVAAHMLPGLAI